MAQDIVDSHEPRTPLFFMPSLFNQTVTLLLESRHYFSTYGKQLEQQLSVMQRAQFSREMSRITIRLSSVMAWLAVQRAILTGELSQKQAQEEFQLDGEEYGLSSDIEAEHMLPDEMCRLLEESRSLYERVHRLHHLHGA